MELVKPGSSRYFAVESSKTLLGANVLHQVLGGLLNIHYLKSEKISSLLVVLPEETVTKVPLPQ